MIRYEPLERAELRAKRATVRDGIIEMLLGGLFLVFGVLFLLGTPFAALGALLPLVMAPLAKWLKQRFVYPRIGYATVARGRRSIRGALITVCVSVFLLVGTLFGFDWLLGREQGNALWLSHFVPAFWGGFVAIGPFIVGRRLRLLRWYVVAALFLLGGILLPILGIATGYDAISLESAIVGGLALLYGIGLFVSFLRTYDIAEVTDATR